MKKIYQIIASVLFDGFILQQVCEQHVSEE